MTFRSILLMLDSFPPAGHRDGPTWGMDRSTPSEQGVDPAGHRRASSTPLEADPRIEPHGLIIQRHGRRIAEGYWAPHTRRPAAASCTR